MQHTMTKSEEILTILGEECAEVIVEISKVKRFGLKENEDRLFKELADLQCMIYLTMENVAGDNVNKFFDNMILQKLDKLKRYSSIFEEPAETQEFPLSEHQRNSVEWFGSPNGA